MSLKGYSFRRHFQDFVRHRTSKSSSASKANREAAILDVTTGLVEYFNVMLGSQLLYKFEREQHSDIIKEHPDTPVSKIYGAIHLLRYDSTTSYDSQVIHSDCGCRLFVKLGGLLTYTPLEAKSVHLLQFYVNEFLQYMKKNASTLFVIQNYATASPEYYRRSL
jgi:mortality factor 4-like protein 1